MELSNLINRERALAMVNQGKGRQVKRPHKRLSQKEQRVEEFLRRLEVKFRRADRGLV